MSDLIDRQVAIDAIEDHIKAYTSIRDDYNMARRHMKELIEVLPSAQQEKRTETHGCDLISRQALMKEFSDFVRESNNSDFARTPTWNDAVSLVGSLPSAQPDKVYEQGWKDGQDALREEIWERERDRLD